MQTRNKNKKGFTIVELVIVIAVIAVLAGVLIPTFSGVFDSANVAKDHALVKNINTAIALDTITTGSPNDAIEIQKIIKKYNLSLETSSKGNYLWYDTVKKCVVLGGLDEEGIRIVDPAISEDVDAQFRMAEILADGIANGNVHGKFKEATSPESFIEGYIFITEESRDGLADAIYALRNPKDAGEGKDADKQQKAIQESLSDALGEIADRGNKTLYDTLSAYMNITAVMTQNGVGQLVDGDSINRVIVSAEKTNLSKADVDKAIGYKNILAVDFHSGIVSIDSDAVAAISAAGNKTYFVFTSDEIDAIDKQDGGDIFRLIHQSERSKYIQKVILKDLAAKTETDIAEFDVEEKVYKFPYNFKHTYFGGSATKTYDFVSYSFYSDGTNPLPTGEGEYMLSELERLLIVDGKLTVYRYYDETEYGGKGQPAAPAFKIGTAYYSSKTMTHMLANEGLPKDTNQITVVSKDAKLDAALIGEDEAKLTIPENVMLFLPFYTTTENKGFSAPIADMVAYLKDNDTAISGVKDGTAWQKEIYGRKYANQDNDKSTVGTADGWNDTMLTIAASVNLINEGTVYVDAQLVGRSGELVQCFVKTDDCSVLVVEGTLTSTGDIKAYGVIRGGGNLIAESGTLSEVFTVLDWNGGMSAKNAISKNVSPFHRWRADNIRVKTTIDAAVEYTATGSVFVDANNPFCFTLSGPALGSYDEDTCPLFLLSADAKIQKTYENNNFHLTVLGGTVDDGAKQLTMTIKGFSVTLKFDVTAVPISEFDLTLNDGAKLILDDNFYKVLPGSDVVVSQGAELMINTAVAFYDDYDLKMIPYHKAPKTVKLEIVVALRKDEWKTITYEQNKAGQDCVTLVYDYYERSLSNLLLKKITKADVKASCCVMGYSDWDDLDAPLTVNGKLTFGENAKFTGDIVSAEKEAQIIVKKGASFTNETTITDVDGNEITVHGFLEGVAFSPNSSVHLDITDLPNSKFGEWQPSYADGVDRTGNFDFTGSTDFKSIGEVLDDCKYDAENKVTFTFDGSVWGSTQYSPS